MVRLAAFALATLLGVHASLPALGQSEEDVYASIETLHGDADGFFELFSLIQDAMMFGDPVTFAANVAYPVTVQANGETYDVLEEQDLVDNFDALVMPETQSAIANQDVDDLIVTSEGVGIADGALWITNICLDDSCGSTQWGIIAVNN